MIATVAGAIHMHSDYSHDGLDSLEQLREVSMERGIRWIGMTDHAEDLDAEIFPEYVAHCAKLSDADFKFVPGLEFRFAGFRGVHLLAIGLTHRITPRTFEGFFAQARDAGCFTVLAHPMLCKHNVPPVVLDYIDAIEIWNTNYNTRYLADPAAIAIYHRVHAARPSVVATVGLDQHDSSNDRGVRTLLSEADLGDPVAALKAGRFKTRGWKAEFDSRATIDNAALMRMRVSRTALDAVTHVQDRVLFAARRMGNKS